MSAINLGSLRPGIEWAMLPLGDPRYDALHQLGFSGVVLEENSAGDIKIMVDCDFAEFTFRPFAVEHRERGPWIRPDIRPDDDHDRMEIFGQFDDVLRFLEAHRQHFVEIRPAKHGGQPA